MAKFYGEVGYAQTVETSVGVWEDQITKRYYKGDTLRNVRRVQNSENLNDDLNVDVQISIVADLYAYENFLDIRYVKWMGALWKVKSVDVQRPRLILSVGGLYNGQTS